MAYFKAHGGGDRVGGSHYGIYDNEYAHITDCGAVQDNERVSAPEFAEQATVFTETHGHLDHIGFSAKFLKLHPGLVGYATKFTRRVSRLMAQDSLKIASGNRGLDIARGREPKPYPFLYPDIDDYIRRMRVVRSSEWFGPAPGVKMRFRSANHMPGAASIDEILRDGTKITLSGDLSIEDTRLVRGTVLPKDGWRADVLVAESTYGNRSLPNRKHEERRFLESIHRVLGRGGKVLIPHFATTGPNVALLVSTGLPADEHGPVVPGVPIRVDGMMRKIMDIYRWTRGWCENDIPLQLNENIFRVGDPDHPEDDWNERAGLISSSEPLAILSTSGMIEGGPSVGYLEGLIENHKNAIFLPGYQAKDTQGRKLLELERGGNFIVTDRWVDRKTGQYRELCKAYKIFCDVERFYLSGHADGDAMAQWICAMDPKMVITVHGEPESHQGLAERVHRLNGTIKVVSGKNGLEIPLEV